jgi:hypothetical protein
VSRKVDVITNALKIFNAPKTNQHSFADLSGQLWNNMGAGCSGTTWGPDPPLFACSAGAEQNSRLRLADDVKRTKPAGIERPSASSLGVCRLPHFQPSPANVAFSMISAA